MHPCPVFEPISGLVMEKHLGTPVRMLPMQQACADTSDMSCGHLCCTCTCPQQQGRTSNYSSSCDDP